MTASFYYRIILLLNLVILSSNLLGQERRVFFRHLSIENGLPTNNISDIEHDNYGFVWIGTREGLYKYDGSELRAIIPSKKHPAFAKPTSISDLYNDPTGKLWIATNAGLFCYSTTYDTLIKFYPVTGVIGNLMEANIIKIHSLNDGRLLFFYDKAIISIFNPITEESQIYSDNGSDKYTQQISGAASIGKKIIFNSQGRLFIGCSNDLLYTLNKDKFEAIPDIRLKGLLSLTLDKNDNLYFIHEETDIYYINTLDANYKVKKLDIKVPAKRILSIAVDKYNVLWISNDDCLFGYNLHLDKFIFKSNNQISLNGRTFRSSANFIVPKEDNVWFARNGYILSYFNHSSNTIVHFINDPTDPNSISERFELHNSNAFNFSQNGVCFLYGVDGINYFSLATTKFSVIQSSKSIPNSISGTNIRGVFVDGEEFVWIGNNEGLSQYNRKTNTFTFFPVSVDIINNITVTEDGNELWIADNSLARFRFNRKNNTLNLVHRYIPDFENPRSLPGWFVTRLMKDRSGVLWVCTANGLAKFNDDPAKLTHGKFQQFKTNPDNSESLPNNLVWDIFQASDGYLWVATSGGLGRFDLKTEKFKNYYTNNTKGSLPTNNIKTITEDNRGRIWLGTEGNGLCMYDNIRDQFISYTMENGLPSNSIYGLIADTVGNLWLSTPNGLSHFNTSNYTIINYTQADGLSGNSFNIQSYASNPETNEILFGGNNGITIFNPSKISISNYIPNLYFTELQLYNEPVITANLDNKHAILEKAIWNTSKIKLKFNENTIQLKFAALDYAAPEKIKYSYLLEGFDKSERVVNNRRNFAAYTNLPPGNYTFRVKSTNSDGVWVENSISMLIIITPPWWATSWFRIGVILFAVGSAYGFYRYRVNALKREKRILETKVAERTAELSEANSQLEERQEEIMTQKEQISQAYDNMQLLSDFGQRITATLNLEAINQMIYDYVSSLMDTQAFGIGIYNEKRKVIEFLHFVEDGQVLPYFTKDLASAKSLSVRCFVNKEEIVIGNLSEEYKRYLTSLPEVQTKKMPVSMVHLPLVVEGRAIGTLTVNSFRTDAYGPNELNNLRSLASYISIALDNASVYKVLRHTNEKVQNSIEYARTIQQAILPLREEMDKHFQSFVLFRPKDVVSGDFYWMQVVDGAIYFAVVDCTGHGVPGAFMSLIGSRLLDEIVKEKGIRQPSQILETLDHELGIALRQGDTENNDGMDICLIKLEHGKEAEEKTWTLTFSGAMRPLYLVQGGELKQLKGDRRSIGGKRTIRKTVIAFTDQSQVLAAGTTLYLSSDGFADQNNGNHDKFGVTALEKLLTVMAPQPLDNQLNQLNNALDTHMGHEEQRDDITMVGIRL